MAKDRIDRIKTEERDHHPAAIRADFYAGDTFTQGLIIQPAKSAILGVNNVTHSKGIVAGAMDNMPDVGIGGRSDGEAGAGVYGFSENGTGVYCKSIHYEALHAETQSPKTAAIAAYNTNPESSAAAFYAKKYGDTGYSAVFDGTVNIVAGNLHIKNGQITINGVSLFDLIYELQQKVSILEAQLLTANELAQSAFSQAQQAQRNADAAAETARKAQKNS